MDSDSPLGRRSEHPDRYAPDVLCAVPRADGRRALGIAGELPFFGVDIWNAHELSWLDRRGKPVVATGEFRVPADSPNLVESKSLKLYLGSLSGERFASAGDVTGRIRADLDRVVGAAVEVALTPAMNAGPITIERPGGTGLDDLDVECATYTVDPELLDGSTTPGAEVDESLYSHLLKSNCPVTGQPDYATVLVRYRGAAIDHAALLRYIVSFRDHAEFHEQCVERIFVDIAHHCAPAELTVYARYTRRGGLDINPFRSTSAARPAYQRVWRQ